MESPDQLWRGLQNLSLSVALLAAAIAIAWYILFQFALKKLPPVQEALGLKKRDKPTRDEMRAEINVMKQQLADSRQHAGQQQPLTAGSRLRQQAQLSQPR